MVGPRFLEFKDSRVQRMIPATQTNETTVLVFKNQLHIMKFKFHERICTSMGRRTSEPVPIPEWIAKDVLDLEGCRVRYGSE